KGRDCGVPCTAGSKQRNRHQPAGNTGGQRAHGQRRRGEGAHSSIRDSYCACGLSKRRGRRVERALINPQLREWQTEGEAQCLAFVVYGGGRMKAARFDEASYQVTKKS